MDWDTYFFKMVKLVASKSKDKSAKVGAVIVGPNNEVRSSGYNGFPKGVRDNVGCRHKRPTKYLWTEHAERNAIFLAAFSGVSLAGCKIYLDIHPCADCARAIIQCGIKEVMINRNDIDQKRKKWDARWKDSIDAGMQMLSEAGVIVKII